MPHTRGTTLSCRSELAQDCFGSQSWVKRLGDCNGRSFCRNAATGRGNGSIEGKSLTLGCSDKWFTVPENAIVASRGFSLTHLLRNHSDRPQPRLHQLRPFRYRESRTPQPKRMAALGVQVHLYGNACLLQRSVVNQ
jgi:hypothetical protein